MIKTLAPSLLCLLLLGWPVVLPSTVPGPKDQEGSVRKRGIERCREMKATARREKPIPIPGEGEILVGPPGAKHRKFEHEPAWYLDLRNFKTLTVADDKGHRDSFPPAQDLGGLMIKAVTSATYEFTCVEGDCISIILYVDQTYELTFTIGEWELQLNLVKGIGNECPDEAIRYLGQKVPAGSQMKLRITPRGIEDIRYDKNGDGNFSSTIKPTSHVFAPKAWDSDGPDIKFSQTVQDASTLLITIKAQDESGVKRVMYALDKSDIYHPGTTVRVDRARPHLIRAFAEDNLGNRSSGDEYTTEP